MKKLFTLSAIILLTISVLAQSPQKMSYQAVIRDASKTLVTSHAVGMRISILLGSVSGTAVYTETQTPTTNANGLVSIEIGGIAGFDAINWAAGAYFIKTETDPTGGTSYTITGTSQVLSVPYALHAKTADNGLSGIGNSLGDILYWNGSAWIPVTVGLPGQYLQLSKLNVPKWVGPTYPTVTTGSASLITANTANVAGNVNDDGGDSVTSRGICYNTYPSPMITNGIVKSGSGTGSFICTLPDLTSSSTYYARAFATNNIGTTYGNEISFSTISNGGSPTVSDVEGNIYNTITIGSQTWMLGNLKTTKYRNGDVIPTTTVPSYQELNAKYQWAYKHNIDSVPKYGRYYTWNVAIDNRGLCPTGFHIPSINEFQVLVDYLSSSGYGYEGSGPDIAKSLAANSFWRYSYIPGTPGYNYSNNNSSGFTAIPAGHSGDTDFYGTAILAEFWTSNPLNDEYQLRAFNVKLYFESRFLDSEDNPRYYGFSVRCVRD